MTLDERAKDIAAQANECCYRSDGWEEIICGIALKHLSTAVEDCAKIAEGHVGNSSSEDACSVSGYDEACRDIAKAIRDAHGAKK